MKNLYKLWLFTRTVLPMLLFYLLLVGATGAANAQERFVSGLKAFRQFQQPQPITQGATGTQENSSFRLNTNNTRSVPLTSMEYDPAGAGWAHATTSAYTYDNAGRLTSIIAKTPAGANRKRMLMAYDERGNMKEYTEASWNGTAWVVEDGWQTINTYDANGRITQSIENDWYNNAWELDDRFELAYNANGDLLTETFYNGTELLGTYTFTYASPNTAPTSILVKEPNQAGVLVDEGRLINITWHSFTNVATGYSILDQDMTGYIGQEWENGAWVNEEKYEATYTANNSFVGIYSDWTNGAWVNSTRYTETFNAQGDQLLWQYEDWANQRWVIDYGRKFTYTYNTANQLTEMMEQDWDQGSGVYRNYIRTVYTSFQTITSSPRNLNPLAAEVYPNPTTDKLLIRTERALATTVKLTSITGQTMLTREFAPSAQPHLLDISSLPAGIYVVNMASGNMFSAKKIIKK